MIGLQLPEIDPRINVLNINGGYENQGLENTNVRMIKFPVLFSPDRIQDIDRSFNLKQNTKFTHVLHNVKSESFFYEFVGGGAGVGKSRLITSIFQALSHL